MQLLFATNNSHKLKEIQEMLGGNINLTGLRDICCFDEIPEDQDTLEGNALQKAQYIYSNYQIDCFADDTGLEVEALGMKPGVYSARYAGEQRNAQDNMAKLLAELKNFSNRKARFRTVIALIIKGKEYLFEGIVDGKIIDLKRGDEGFGYDPIFVPDGYDLTFAEMPLSEKNKISHRARAFRKLEEFLKTLS
ncbi:MAG: non-canonical purine NTP pyrophosphatase [Bacteroidetes bacterium GWF2_38_335]|nr:MAG: non-canonical purine NTP pyrophosphatase [Bacteroidetes bacterium GWF2_38_335]OFY76954.1 MAG: non-canonical purine NTP pyrophosphatase [Bacteroidetes bacterium RIFOXYA12_FULL_38_20]HBS86808.1 non-canonical purine NTP pyrophosphatase [Bacteroidales bacterium]